MKGRIQHPMYTAARLTVANPVLLAGEVVYESDTSRHKIGDGVKAWNVLPYARGGDFEGPISASKVTQDATHRFVTDAEKSAWNAKAAATAATKSANGLMSAADKMKLDGIAAGANAYTHPSSHPASIIAQDATHRFVTDSEKAAWDKAVSSTSVRTIAGPMTAAQYAALTPDASTLYIITD